MIKNNSLMGKLSEFNVLLQNSQNGNAVYTSGQTISGSVVAVLNDSIELKGKNFNVYICEV